MFYHLKDHIYITQFRDEIILLDTKQDKYIICFNDISLLLIDLLAKESTFSLTDNLLAGEESNSKNIPNCDSKTQSPIHEQDYIQKLIDDSIIEKKAIPYPFYVDRKSDSIGVSNVSWSLPVERQKVPLTIEVLKAFITLLKVNFYIKVKGFYFMIQRIKNARKNEGTYIIPSEEDLTQLATIVNKACLVYPTRTKCLEWAITFVLLALKRKWKCNLEIGVQNYPFFAHAWVECDGKVVMDSQGLREGLGIILNEPFRKVKI